MKEDMLHMANTIAQLEQERAAVEANRALYAPENIIQSLGPVLEANIRQHIQPFIAEANQSMSRMLKDHTDDVASNVMSKVAIAVKVSETLNAWLRNSQFAAPT